jgi:hypothetical protein
MGHQIGKPEDVKQRLVLAKMSTIIETGFSSDLLSSRD